MKRFENKSNRFFQVVVYKSACEVGAEIGGAMLREFDALFISGEKLFAVATNGDVFSIPEPPRLSLALDRIRISGSLLPFLDVEKAQIVCETGNARMALRRMLWELLPPEVAGKIIPLPVNLQIPTERKLALVVGE